jgi:hypothetical protein
MRIDRESSVTKLVLDPSEVPLLKLALEKANFIDTPVAQQAAIASFCNRVLEALKQQRRGQGKKEK